MIPTVGNSDLAVLSAESRQNQMTSENEFPQQKVNLYISSFTLHTEQSLFRDLNNPGCKNLTLCQCRQAWVTDLGVNESKPVR